MDLIDFRPATKKDITEIIDLLNSLSDEEKKFFHPHPFNKSTLMKIFNSENDYYFVLIVNNKIIGYSMLRFFGTKIPSFGICLRKDYENQGYGSIMIEKTIKKAKELGYTEVILHVHKENSRAIDIYKQTGFKITQQNLDTRVITMKIELQ